MLRKPRKCVRSRFVYQIWEGKPSPFKNVMASCVTSKIMAHSFDLKWVRWMILHLQALMMMPRMVCMLVCFIKRNYWWIILMREWYIIAIILHVRHNDEEKCILFRLPCSVHHGVAWQEAGIRMQYFQSTGSQAFGILAPRYHLGAKIHSLIGKMFLQKKKLLLNVLNSFSISPKLSIPPFCFYFFFINLLHHSIIR